MVVRALHYAHTYEHVKDVTPDFVMEWTTFAKFRVSNIVLGLIESKHVIRNDDEFGTIKLTKKGRAWVTRQ